MQKFCMFRKNLGSLNNSWPPRYGEYDVAIGYYQINYISPGWFMNSSHKTTKDTKTTKKKDDEFYSLFVPLCAFVAFV